MAALQLPEARPAATRARLRRRFPDARESAPPARAPARCRQTSTRYSWGKQIDLSGVALDFDGVPPFYRQVYEVARTIPAGATLTYGEVAKRLGKPGSARAVGQALGKNPFAVVVPCHRVLAAGGKPGGFSAEGGVSTKLRMLAIEQRGLAERLRLRSRARPRARAREQTRRSRRSSIAWGRSACSCSTRRICSARCSNPSSSSSSAARPRRPSTAACSHCFPRTPDGPTPTDILRAPDDKLRGAGLSAEQAAQRARSRAAQRRRRDPDASPRRGASTTRR